MAELTARQRGMIETLVGSAPDLIVSQMSAALSSERQGPMSEIRIMVAEEMSQRRARGVTFAPLVALASGTGDAPQTPISQRIIAELWKALRSQGPDQVAQAVAASEYLSEDEELDPVFDNLCSAAAMGLRSAEGTAFEAAAGLIADAGEDADVASYLDLVPLSRQAIAKLPEWSGRMTDERAAAVRLAYNDATAIAADAGPRFLEILAGHLDDPAQVLRLVSAIDDRPTDRFLDESELGGLGRQFLDDIDRQIERLRAFDPEGGEAAGTAAAACVSTAYRQIAEFENNLDLKRDGPWGSRIQQQKNELTKFVEGILKRVDDAVAQALPLKSSRNRKTRGHPNFEQSPSEAASTRAKAYLTFVECSRSSAQAGGFATMRSKVVEMQDDRLDHYIDDILENLRADSPEAPENSATYMETTAQLVECLRGEKEAQILRRRAAA